MADGGALVLTQLCRQIDDAGAANSCDSNAELDWRSGAARLGGSIQPEPRTPMAFAAASDRTRTSCGAAAPRAKSAQMTASRARVERDFNRFEDILTRCPDPTFLTRETVAWRTH